jgi:hypothetical protein
MDRNFYLSLISIMVLHLPSGRRGRGIVTPNLIASRSPNHVISLRAFSNEKIQFSCKTLTYQISQNSRLTGIVSSAQSGTSGFQALRQASKLFVLVSGQCGAATLPCNIHPLTSLYAWLWPPLIMAASDISVARLNKSSNTIIAHDIAQLTCAADWYYYRLCYKMSWLDACLSSEVSYDSYFLPSLYQSILHETS